MIGHRRSEGAMLKCSSHFLQVDRKVHTKMEMRRIIVVACKIQQTKKFYWSTMFGDSVRKL